MSDGATLARRPAAIVTGASSGIGRATALHLARAGYDLVLGARRERELAGVAARAREEFGARAAALGCDVTSEEDVRALVESALHEFGRVDAMVCCAGAGLYGRVEDTPPDEYRDLFEINVMGVVHAVRAAIPVMRRQGRGRFVAVGSVNGRVSWPFHGPYAATKFALTGVMEALRNELAGSGVTATLVLPASTRTAFFGVARTFSGYQPRPIGVSQSADQVARRVVRAVQRPSSEVSTLPWMRPAYAAAAAFPGLVDAFARRYYLRIQNEKK